MSHKQDARLIWVKICCALVELFFFFLQQIHISPHERDFTIDLVPFMNPGSYTIQDVSIHIPHSNLSFISSLCSHESIYEIQM